MGGYLALDRYYGVNSDTGTIVDLGIHPSAFSAECAAGASDRQHGRSKGHTQLLQDQDNLRQLLKSKDPNSFFFYSLGLRAYVYWGEYRNELTAKMALLNHPGAGIGRGVCPPVRAKVLLEQLENVAPFV